MTEEKFNKLINILNDISNDAKLDALSLDNQPFNGKTMGDNLGKIYAAIRGLSNILKETLKDNNGY